MKKIGLVKILKKSTFAIEMVLTAIIGIVIIISVKDLLWYLPTIWNTSTVASYSLVKDFLGHVLLLVVAVEMMLMLLNHSMFAITELVVFVIARKMLIYANTMMDLLLGTLSLMVVYATFKYFRPSVNITSEKVVHDFLGSDSVEKIKEITGFPISSAFGKDLNEIIKHFAEEKRVKVCNGLTLQLGDIDVIAKEVKDGNVVKVSMVKNVKK